MLFFDDLLKLLNFSFSRFVVAFGGSALPPAADTKIIVPAAKKILHPDWSPVDMANDIAILVLSRTLTKEETSGRNTNFALHDESCVLNY